MYGQLLGRNYFRLAEVGGRSSRPAQKVGRRRKSAGLGESLALRRSHNLRQEGTGVPGDDLPLLEATTLQERRRGSCDN